MLNSSFSLSFQIQNSVYIFFSKYSVTEESNLHSNHSNNQTFFPCHFFIAPGAWRHSKYNGIMKRSPPLIPLNTLIHLGTQHLLLCALLPSLRYSNLVLRQNNLWHWSSAIFITSLPSPFYGCSSSTPASPCVQRLGRGD